MYKTNLKIKKLLTNFMLPLDWKFDRQFFGVFTNQYKRALRFAFRINSSIFFLS